MRLSTFVFTTLAASIVLLPACNRPAQKDLNKTQIIAKESIALNHWFEARFEDSLARSPMSQTYLGRKTAYDKLDDASQIALDESAALTEQWLKDMRKRFDIDRLDDQSKLSYQLFEFSSLDELASYEFGGNDYVFQHMSGPHNDLPSFMINFHSITDSKDAEAYIERLIATERYIGQHMERAEAQLLNDVILPKFVYAKLIPAAQNVISGAPFESGEDSPLLADFKSKLSETDILSADEIHEIGLKEVARIQDEMREIMRQVEFDGTLRDFYKVLRTDPKFVFPNTDAGREAYIAKATAIIDDMKGRLDSLFITKPKADMIVKRVEAFREDTAFGAFYDQPALDGTRPGTYYINLKDVAEQPKYLAQALAYHEGIPGHHMQIAIGMELEGLPQFRTLGGHTAYIEGWALYAESVPKELGLYTDPYADFGRLSMEIFRAARLVVDTGIHSKRWTREDAVQYYLDNIPNPEGDVRAEIDRYIVWPGQATAYKIGMLKIMELRKNAETTLGDKFDIREFHDVILANGSVPLDVLEDLVMQWVQSKS